MRKETRKNILRVLNYAKDYNCSIKSACNKKKYNYNSLLNTIKYTRDNGIDNDIISLYER